MIKLVAIVSIIAMLTVLGGCAEIRGRESESGIEDPNTSTSSEWISNESSSSFQIDQGNLSESSEVTVGKEFDGELPINDEFIALDAAKDFLGLDDYEKYPNGSGGYTYRKGNYELGGNGHWVIKKTNEPFFLVTHIQWDESLLAKDVYKPLTRDDYAVLRETGKVIPITEDEY